MEMNSIKPFWSWNDKLDKEELERQIVQMKENGIEGFFMHARAGLRTPYMSEEWFDMIEACLNKADELDMQAWAYDENGWPSGFADGLVTDLGVEHQQKSLKYILFNGENAPKDHILAMFRKTEQGFSLVETPEQGTLIFYYHVNPYYVDVFNRETIANFLRLTHEKYFKRFGERFGSSLKGFFTDEPQFCASPWSHVFPQEFEKVYGYSLIENLPLLFFETDGYQAVRNDFHSLVARLFQESFIKQMFEWCEEHHCKLTGHMMGENTLMKQMNSSNGVMACYEYFHEPGIDHLRRRIVSPILPKQLGSVAYQLGKKTLTETFGLCGWDVSLNELKWIAQWQYLNGVTSLCPHLESYSLRGIRKRDYPASYFTQLPWFGHVYSDFADYFSKLGALLDSGRDIAPLLVIHPISSAYILHQPSQQEMLEEYHAEFERIAQELNDEHILHHYGDETIISRHGSIEKIGSRCVLSVGQCKYSAVLLPNLVNLSSHTVNILLEYAGFGGKIYAVGQLPEFENGRKTERIEELCSVIQTCNSLKDLKDQCTEVVPVAVYDTDGNAIDVHVALKELDAEGKLLYLTNNAKKEQTVTVEIDGSHAVFCIDIMKKTEERMTTRLLDGKTLVTFHFSEYGSAVCMLRESAEGFESAIKPTENVALRKEFEVVDCDVNALTLDKCIYRVDDGEWQSEIAVINLQNQLLELQRPCHVDMLFTFNIAEEIDFTDIKLCMEDPEKYDISINGNIYKFEDSGMFVDHAIRTSRIGDCLRVGVNTIQLSCCFTQSPELYHAKFTPGVHESILNKLTYDTELESIYITGNFGVRMDETYHLGERRCLYGGKTFHLTKRVEKVDITDITHQGFWFFSGEMHLAQNVYVKKTEGKSYVIRFEQLNAPAASVYVNDCLAGNIMFSPFEVDVTELLKDGENKVTVHLFSGNRNLLGPHHKPEGESYSVGPDTFSNKRGWTDDPSLPTWTDNYNFVLFGVEL